MKTLSLAVLFGASITACTFPNTIATYPSITQPILLGPVDHVGGGGPLKSHGTSQKLRTEFVHSVTSTEQSTTEVWSTKSAGTSSAKLILGTDLKRDVHVTELETSATGAFFGVSMEANAEVQGDVVEIEAKQ